MRKRRIVLADFDDTLFFTKHLIELASRKILKKNISKEDVRKLPKNIKSKIYEKAFKEYAEVYEVNEELRKILKSYMKKGFEIIILTARENKFEEETKRALEKHSIAYDEIIFRKDISIPDEEWKADIIHKLCKRAELIILFEDKLENISYIKQRVKAKNIKYFLVRREKILKV